MTRETWNSHYTPWQWTFSFRRCTTLSMTGWLISPWVEVLSANSSSVFFWMFFSFLGPIHHINFFWQLFRTSTDTPTWPNFTHFLNWSPYWGLGVGWTVRALCHSFGPFTKWRKTNVGADLYIPRDGCGILGTIPLVRVWKCFRTVKPGEALLLSGAGL